LADERDDIRSRISIVDLVSREVPLKQKGKNWWGLCPFHSDKTPSFSVTPDTGRYKCWSCSATGDIFDWVMKRQNVEFAEAIQILAKEAGVTLRRGGGLPENTRNNYERAMDAALTFFRDQLPQNPVAMAYCARRGLDQATLDAWQIGYAPDHGDALPAYLRRNGVALSDAKAVFLTDEDSRGGYYGKFRGRLMFPIRNEKGALVAFGGRILGDGHPKYINSGDTPLYHKSRVLYGMHRARDQMAKERRAVLVEGYLDVIACHLAGVTTAVASLGTALAEDHARLLKRWCDEVTILYDSDKAGQNAAERAVRILEAEGLRVRIALLPDGQDPDTLLKSAGGEAVRAAVDAGLTRTDFRMQALEKRLPASDETFWPEAMQLLAEETNELIIVRQLDRLAGLYPATRDLQEAKLALRRMIGRARHAAQPAPGTQRERPRAAYAGPTVSATRKELKSAETVIFLAFLDDHLRRYGWIFAGYEELFDTGLARRISVAIKATYPQPPVGKPSEWLSKLEDEELQGILADLVHDFMAKNLSEEFLKDTVEMLQKRVGVRKLQDKKNMGEGRDLAEIQEMLRSINPDKLNKPKSGDDLF